MKPLHLGIGLAMVLTACQPLALMAPPTVETYLDDQVLVRFEAETAALAREALRAKYGARNVETLPSGTERWHVSGAPKALAGAIAREAGVKAAQPNWIRRLQAFSPPDKDYQNQKQWHLQKGYLNMAEIWNDAGFSTQARPGAGITVAVVDSGVDLGHPDLLPNFHKDASNRPIYLDEAPDASGTKVEQFDPNGHGTHVAGIIAAAAAGDGTTTYGTGSSAGNIVGVAPGAKLLPVRVMDSQGNGNDFTIAKGIDNAVAWRHPSDGTIKVNVINLSIGGPNPSPALAASLANAAKHGVLVIAAAGNYNVPVYYPAAYPGALAVGALTPHNQRASYSCYGPQLALMAPGGADPHEASEALNSWSGIHSTVPTYPNGTNKLYYGTLAGTSMATPVVTGVAALILAQNYPRNLSLTPDQLRMRLLATATDIGPPGFDNLTGWGMINPKRALEWVAHDEMTP